MAKFGGRGWCSGCRSASGLALINDAGRHDASPETACDGDRDVGQGPLTGRTSHSTSIEPSAIAAGA